jgi:hypothetical protein
MTEPNQPNPTGNVDPPPPVDPTAPLEPDPSVDPAPPVQPETPVDPAPPVQPETPVDPTAPADPPPPVDPQPSPDRPRSTDWREPPWFPPRDKDRRERRANLGAIAIGFLILGIGVYYFLDRTIGLTMPRIQWGSLWPILLIVLGGLVLLRSIDRR